MPNPATIDGLPAVLVANETVQSVRLNGDREYSVAHDGETRAGAADTATVYLAIGDDASASPEEGPNRVKLIAGRSVSLPPNTEVLTFVAASGGAPTFSVVPSGRLYGRR